MKTAVKAGLLYFLLIFIAGFILGIIRTKLLVPNFGALAGLLIELPVILLLVMACSSDQTSPGNPPDVPADLFSTTLNGAVALSWPDNAYESDPDNFQSYRIYSTTYNIDAPAGTDPCGTSWTLEGTTVAPEFLVGAMVNGVSRCFSVSSASQTGVESNRSRTVFDTPRPDSRNQVLYPIQVKSDSSGFRFWDDDGDNVVEESVFNGTNDGPLTGPDGSQIPATGRQVSEPFSGLHTVRDGRIISTRFYFDQLDMLTQLGLMPAS